MVVLNKTSRKEKKNGVASNIRGTDGVTAPVWCYRFVAPQASSGDERELEGVRRVNCQESGVVN